MDVLLYDGSFEGLLTCIYDGFYSKTAPSGIYSSDEFNAPLLLGNTITISSDETKFKKVKNAIKTKIDILALKKIYIVYLSNHPDKGMIIFNYLKTAFKLGKDVHLFLNFDEVRIIDEINKRVTLESHRFKGFVRFNYIDDKFLYSSIEPDNDILELLAEHFRKRFSQEYFIIHDISREKALIYNRSTYEIVPMSMDDYNILKKHNDEYSELWKAYFKSTAIKERRNLKLQSRMMPKRYWKHILEQQ